MRGYASWLRRAMGERTSLVFEPEDNADRLASRNMLGAQLKLATAAKRTVCPRSRLRGRRRPT